MAIKFYKNGEQVSGYTTSYSGKNIIISIDSSKSNTAMFVWDEFGYPLDDYEISGEGADVEVFQLCWDTRIQLENLLKGAKVLLVGIEDIITKSEKGYRGIEYHQSRHKITAVYDNLVFFFQIYHNMTPKLINNQTWKSHVLPEEFRKRDYDKGSKDWCKALGNRWANRKDDVTDAYCIGLYLLMSEKIEAFYSVDFTEPAKGTYTYGIFPSSFPLPAGSKKFVIKNNDTLQHNAATVSNKVDVGQPGVFTYPIDKLTLDELYSSEVLYNNEYKFNREDTSVQVIVYSKS